MQASKKGLATLNVAYRHARRGKRVPLSVVLVHKTLNCWH